MNLAAKSLAVLLGLTLSVSAGDEFFCEATDGSGTQIVRMGAHAILTTYTTDGRRQDQAFECGPSNPWDDPNECVSAYRNHQADQYLAASFLELDLHKSVLITADAILESGRILSARIEQIPVNCTKR